MDEAFAAVLPRLSLDGRYESRSNDRGIGTTSGPTATVGDRAVTTGTASLIVPIYDFGGSFARKAAEEARVEESIHDVEDVRRELALSVTRAYYRVLEAQRILEVVEESLRTLREQAASARDFLAVGLVARSDVLGAEVQLARRGQERIEAGNNLQLARASLNRLMGDDVEAPVDLSDVLEAPPWEGAFRAALERALALRPDLRSLGDRIVASRAELRATKAEYAPGIFGFASYNTSTDTFLLHRDWLAGGVGVRWSIFDGWGTDARVRRAEKGIEDSLDAREDLAADVALEVKQAYLAVREAEERIPVSRSGVALAEENLRSVRDQYREGLVTTADVLAEEERRAAARSSYVRSLYGQHEACARLLHAMGGLPPGADAAGRSE